MPPFCPSIFLQKTVYEGRERNIPTKNRGEWNIETANKRKGRRVIVVKGVTRQVILVKSPDPKLFEEAIFIVREEALNREGVSAEQVILQARQAADGYLRRAKAEEKTGGRFLSPAFWLGAGALVSSAVWAVGLLLL